MEETASKSSRLPLKNEGSVNTDMAETEQRS